MTNWFAGIGQAMSGLDAARYGLSVVSQNIANADTDGYTRQVVNQGSVDGMVRPSLYTGRVGGTSQLNGTTVLDTARVTDPVLDARVRNEHAKGGAADTTAAQLYQHAFSASSRVLTTIDQMLDTLINHTGMVGLS
jgi:flagellar hook-associated protein 1